MRTTIVILCLNKKEQRKSTSIRRRVKIEYNVWYNLMNVVALLSVIHIVSVSLHAWMGLINMKLKRDITIILWAMNNVSKLNILCTHISIYNNNLRYRYYSRILRSQCRSTRKWFDVTNCCYNISLLRYRICSLKGHTQTTIESCARGNVILWLQMKCKSIINSEMNSTWGYKKQNEYSLSFLFLKFTKYYKVFWLSIWLPLNEIKD